ncbi:hypothetical protein GUITHDRAFT_155247 [Guillardia theta CCMP2712]|uniref:Uncharacterized protein n=1 Tax=Guillardia theta (strain CCMP2712) TaxID=905079 RepID=L1IJZ7_GUITC|nr:hypothetical protein GUITHDRAFT_155247 [Guillardia theta CCMP2712]EKX36427.1 hypothetical protein GUITHDRAFT_155247 [Guillardia theta CCMP2712]|eukprot:XP_005823407.1 hypothetical protein GUITHDRAFT_155247 [Guillardia theta CCMP2712]
MSVLSPIQPINLPDNLASYESNMQHMQQSMPTESSMASVSHGSPGAEKLTPNFPAKKKTTRRFRITDLPDN